MRTFLKRQSQILLAGLWLLAVLATVAMFQVVRNLHEGSARPVARMASIRGSVQYREAVMPIWSYATPMQSIYDHTLVATGRSDSAVLDFGDGHKLRLGNDTMLLVQAADPTNPQGPTVTLLQGTASESAAARPAGESGRGKVRLLREGPSNATPRGAVKAEEPLTLPTKVAELLDQTAVMQKAASTSVAPAATYKGSIPHLVSVAGGDARRLWTLRPLSPAKTQALGSTADLAIGVSPLETEIASTHRSYLLLVGSGSNAETIRNDAPATKLQPVLTIPAAWLHRLSTPNASDTAQLKTRALQLHVGLNDGTSDLYDPATSVVALGSLMEQGPEGLSISLRHMRPAQAFPAWLAETPDMKDAPALKLWLLSGQDLPLSAGLIASSGGFSLARAKALPSQGTFAVRAGHAIAAMKLSKPQADDYAQLLKVLHANLVFTGALDALHHDLAAALSSGDANGQVYGLMPDGRLLKLRSDFLRHNRRARALVAASTRVFFNKTVTIEAFE